MKSRKLRARNLKAMLSDGKNITFNAQKNSFRKLKS